MHADVKASTKQVAIKASSQKAAEVSVIIDERMEEASEVTGSFSYGKDLTLHLHNTLCDAQLWFSYLKE